MKFTSMTLQGTKTAKIYTLDTVIIGSGAAGYKTADTLYRMGRKEIAIVTNGIKMGTSRNTGSDKQTYYKLTLAGNSGDSVYDMAKTLFEGQCVDGDLALCEAALSAQSFYSLVGLGVPFPSNEYGEYVGYKTDHDPFKRATSAGPYTSKFMTELLEKSVNQKNIEIFDKMQAVKVIKSEDDVICLICINDQNEFECFLCSHLVFATGAPAEIYADSVYPYSQTGASAIAFEAGVKGKNLTEWQYGLASKNPRWNVSGTYMQSLPRFISTNADGSDKNEFLLDYFDDKFDMMSKIFLKGYQWPLNVNKIKNGSSIIDLLVYLETAKGRRVFLDFTKNCQNEAIDFSRLSPEAFQYLQDTNALFGTPIERLRHMNLPAVNFYLDKNVDLSKEMLEISLCAQHNNGGLVVDCNWQTNIDGIYAVGEAACTHGVNRPGGTALNAGQVGATRAANHIAQIQPCEISPEVHFATIKEHLCSLDSLINKCLCKNGSPNISKFLKTYMKKMSVHGAALRKKDDISTLLAEIKLFLNDFSSKAKISSADQIKPLFLLRDTLICQSVYLSSMEDYINHNGKSRGSAIYFSENGERPYDFLPDYFKLSYDNGEMKNQIQEISYKDCNCSCEWRSIRPIPQSNQVFENVWSDYRKRNHI